MTENNLQLTQMSVAKPDEHKPVMCRCGVKMRLIVDRCVDWKQVPVFRAYYRCKCGWWSPVCTDYIKSIARDKAYAAATKRPPNLPLTESALMALNPASDAVWYVIDGWTEQSQVISAHSAQSEPSYWLSVDMLLFAAPPTPADIEAARKERTNE